MNRKERALLEEIKRDCLELEEQGELTEFGQGELRLIKMLESL